MHQSTAEVVVRVVDVNDNPPLFSEVQYVFSVREGRSTPPAVGRLVGVVHAKDGDLGMNANITYSFVEGAFAFTEHKFLGFSGYRTL